jgi:hypothetical protein
MLSLGLHPDRVGLQRFLVTWTGGFGVRVATDGGLDLQSGELSHAEIAAGVRVDGYDTGRLNHDVTYRDNVRSLDSSTVPLPDIPPSVIPSQ